MGTQSILEISREKYLTDREAQMKQMSESYFLNTNFLLGKREDRDKQTFIMQSYRYLCTDICEMTRFIQNKLEGKMEEAPIVRERRTIIDTLLAAERYIKDQNCTLEEAINECCTWEAVQW